jgi:hypothetical protein
MTTATKQACFLPQHNHLLMVHLDVTEQHITFTLPDGIALKASYLHALTGAVVRDVTIHLQGSVTLHCVASKKEAFKGWYYLMQWSERFHRYGCSCLEGKAGWCEHMQLVEQPTEIIA